VDALFRHLSARPLIVVALVATALALLPVAVWLDLRSISDHALTSQANDLSSMITDIRSYYARNVVARVLNSSVQTQTLPNYHEIEGAIPIPATMSIELGQVINEEQSNIRYRFVSDFPFATRLPHLLDAFEQNAIAAFRAGRDPEQPIYETTGSIFNRQIRMVTPVIMGETCVACHNTHPLSPKTDWKVGDVRGIQEVFIDQPIAANIFSFKYLLIYFLCAATIGLTFAVLQWRQARTITSMNRELEDTNNFLSVISMKISKYLSPQVYKSIFSGETDVTISTRRKKLTIFFSDIKDFTATTERLQPEELTGLLNEYLTEMAGIALAHGATVDKFIGDAILVFFGDPETRGEEEDAKACLRMAIDMQRRMTELNAQWRRRGIEMPFQIRMGINTGYCNVGNFGSMDRMDYTIIGAEANLAARLESVAEAGGIVMSYETYALVRDVVHARQMPAMSIKGISRKVVPYVVESIIDDGTGQNEVISEHAPGVDLFLDVNMVDPRELEHIRHILGRAITLIETRRA